MSGDPRAPGSRLAIVGSGIAGLVAARELHRDHDITVFEAGHHVGGHTNTIDVGWRGRRYAVDTGFIVFNDWTYPNFTRLLGELGVAVRPTTMSFSVSCERSGLEYNGTSFGGLFAQRRNLVRPRFLRMLAGILRFHRRAVCRLPELEPAVTLGEFLQGERIGADVVDRYVVPMGAAIWSARPAAMLDFPARSFLGFLHNHGMLSVDDRPTWRVVDGGSRRYVAALTAPFADRIELATPVRSIRRESGAVVIDAAGRPPARFDGVILATHSDQALRLLADPTPAERAILGAIPYQENTATLHTDARVLPRTRRAWAAWNYRIPAGAADRVSVTYAMNALQGLDAPVQFCVTLNDSGRIDPGQVLRRIVYHHPVFTADGIAAQARRGEISGRHRTWFCGAYWHNGFHEDGVVSGLEVAADVRAAAVEAA